MNQNVRMTCAAFDMCRTSELLINALLDAMPEDRFGETDIQQAMLTYLEGSSKFQADVAMFMAQSKVSNG